MIKIIRRAPPLRITMRGIVRNGFSFLRPGVVSEVPVRIMVRVVAITLHQGQFLLVAERTEHHLLIIIYNCGSSDIVDMDVRFLLLSFIGNALSLYWSGPRLIKVDESLFLDFRLFGPCLNYHFGSGSNDILGIPFFVISFFLGFLNFLMGFLLHFFQMLLGLPFFLFV